MKNKQLGRVTEKSHLKISFNLKLADGTTVDKTEKGELLELVVGDGQLINRLDELFIGLEEGTSAKFNLSPIQAYGQTDSQNIQTMKTTDFPSEMKLKEGLVIGFDSPTGDEVLGSVFELSKDKVLIDFNHPLAGKDIIFEFKIEKIITSKV